ncbi:MAG: hypothetical protein WC095_00565 [Candidatus Paceibacterota bacterium]
MEKLIENQDNKEAEPKIEVVFDYSVEDEKERVFSTLKKYHWYKENGYKPKYPKLIQERLEKDEKVKKEDILEAVSAEFDQEKYREEVDLIIKEWDEIKDKFFESLKTLNLPLQDKYFVCVTKYGTGGSYGLPNNVQLNIEQKRVLTITLAHEIVHLTIEPLIKEYKITHWVKERLVDLIIDKFFPESKRIQRDPENSEKVSEIFEKYFPDINKIIIEISKP